MDAGGRQALPREVGGEEVSVLLGLDKDQSPLLGVALRVLHQLLQLRALVKLGNLIEILYINLSKAYSSEELDTSKPYYGLLKVDHQGQSKSTIY